MAEQKVKISELADLGQSLEGYYTIGSKDVDGTVVSRKCDLGFVQTAATKAETAADHAPKIEGGVWFVWDSGTSAYVSTGVNATGDTGATGATGNGIASVVQTTTSTADGGMNIVTVTMTDGTVHTFQFLNGSKGSKGDTGAQGAQGEQGIQGETGAQGTAGASGLLAYNSNSDAAPTVALAWDNLYQLLSTALTAITFTLPSAPADSTHEIVIKFTTGTTAPTIAFSGGGIIWIMQSEDDANGKAVTMAASTTYDISISYDMAAGKFTAVYGLFKPAA